jgi:F420H(2)-dependent quinone reductase
MTTRNTRSTAGLSRADRWMLQFMRAFTRVHRVLVRRGVTGRNWMGGELVLLTVTGRRSGKAITVPLIALPDGDDLLVAASQGGVDSEPQWWLNLQANPRAEAEFGGERFPVVARKVDDAERPAVWARFVATTDRFTGYQGKVRREIALIRLRRV